MAELNWTAEAQRWLQEIYEYIARNNPGAAAGVIEGIFRKAQVLVDFPQIGHRYDALPGREARVLLYGPLSNRLPHQGGREHRHSRCVPWGHGDSALHKVA